MIRLVLMEMCSEFRSWVRAVIGRRRLEEEMEAELASHLECLTADLVRAGYSPKEARRRARVALGSEVVAMDGMRSSLGLRLWDELWADLRYGARRLRRSVGFTLIAVLSLALAIGANTAIFSVARQVLYERLGVAHPEQLRLLEWSGDKNFVGHEMWGDFDPTPEGIGGSVFPFPAYEALKAQNRVMQGLVGFKDDSMNATVAGNARQVQVEMVSGNYYPEIGVRPALGRGILPSDDIAGGPAPVAVISDGLWEREFGRAANIVGQRIRVNQTAMTIVGVNPRGFTGVKSALQSPDLFVPLTMQPVIDGKPGPISQLKDAEIWWVNVMARTKLGVADAQARAALETQFNAILRATVTVKATDTMPRLRLEDGSRGLHGMDQTFRKPMTVLLSLTGLVLLLACANIANLMLARGAGRQREIGVRMALGAGRSRIVRQMLVESLLLAGLGGMGGLIVGYLGSQLIPKIVENAWEGGEFHTHFDGLVFLFAAAVTVATGVLFGLAPAIAASRTAVSSDLKEGSQTLTRRRGRWGGKGLVGFQIALSTLLVVGASLFLRTLVALNAVQVGFATDHLLLAEINPPTGWYPPGKDVALHQRIEEAFQGTPGVQWVAPGGPFIADSWSKSSFLIERETPGKDQDTGEFFNVTGNEFFHTMQIPILAGRGFGPQDTATSAKVGVINARLARERFPNQNPIGKRFATGPAEGDKKQEWIEVIGVCGDTRYGHLREEPPAQFFLPYVQQPEVGGMTYEIRSQLSLEALTPALRAALRRIDPDLPMVNVRTQRQQIEADTQQERLFVMMASGFGVLALALATVGIYGVMAYSVAGRTNEIGIRLALGALPRQVLTMVLREASWVSLAGVAVGIVAALPLARLVKSMLYGLQPSDPVSLLCAAALLIAVGLAASWIPARRAASVEPMEALRHE